MKFSIGELIVIKDALYGNLEAIYTGTNWKNAKEMAFEPIAKFDGDDYPIGDIINTQSALKKIIEEFNE